MKKSLNKESIKRILVTRMQGMGDVICFIPALRGLRENFPSAEITLLVGRRFGRDIAKNCSFADKVLFYDIEKRRAYLEKLKFILSLRREKFDLIISSSQEVGFALKAFLIGARYRVGFKENKINNITARDRFSFLNTISIVSHMAEHEIETNLKILKALGMEGENKTLELGINKEDILYITRMFENYHILGRIIIAVHPSSNRIVKNWPGERYAEMLRYLIKRYSPGVVLIGGKEAIRLNEKVAKLTELELVNLTGKLTIGQLIALLSMSDLFIGNDSGPMHIAAALNISIVALFGPGDETRFSPPSNNCLVINKHVDCAPCNRQNCSSNKCMKLITAEEVIKAAEYFGERIPVGVDMNR